jgi:4-hydroxybenzoate polyprenyltransferase
MNATLRTDFDDDKGQAMRAYAQLVRLPNVFTALADIGLGAFIASAQPTSLDASWWVRLVLVALASVCLYSAGMVLNDYFDREIDRKERPDRPIPSGRVAARNALIFGIVLLGLGNIAATTTGREAALLATALVVAILAYNGGLKHTWAGPLVMGSCRGLNVLLGLTLTNLDAGWRVHLALLVGLYITGVTLFARTEARSSHPALLGLAATLMTLAIGLAIPLPANLPAGTTTSVYPYALAAMACWIGLPVWEALRRPTPTRVQAAVKRAIFGLVAFDAVLASVFAGPAALMLFLLVIPGLILGRWLYST